MQNQLLADGLSFDVSSTSYFQGTASGGMKDTFRFGGRDDYLVNVDGQKAGLWQGFSVNLHGESVYGDSVNITNRCDHSCQYWTRPSSLFR